MRLSVKIQNFICITVYILLCIVLILYTLLRTESITYVLPELKDIHTEEIVSYEVVTDSESYKKYTFISNPDKLKLLGEKLSVMSVRRSLVPMPKMTSSTNIKINFRNGSAKYLKFYGERNYIPNTKYYVVTYIFNLRYPVGESDVKVNSDTTLFKTYFKSETEGISVIKTALDFKSYIDSLQYGEKGNLNEKEHYISQYNEDFFADKTLLAVAVRKTETQTNFYFDGLKVSDGKLQVNYNYMPCAPDSDSTGETLEIHLFETDNKELEDINEYEISKQNITEIEFVREVLNIQ